MLVAVDSGAAFAAYSAATVGTQARSDTQTHYILSAVDVPTLTCHLAGSYMLADDHEERRGLAVRPRCMLYRRWAPSAE